MEEACLVVVTAEKLVVVTAEKLVVVTAEKSMKNLRTVPIVDTAVQSPMVSATIRLRFS